MKKPKHPYPLPALPLQETKPNHYNSTSAIFVPPTYSDLYQRRSHKEKLISTIFEVSTLNPNDYQGILDVTSQLLAFEEHHTVVRDPNDHRTSSLYGAVDESYVPKHAQTPTPVFYDSSLPAFSPLTASSSSLPTTPPYTGSYSLNTNAPHIDGYTSPPFDDYDGIRVVQYKGHTAPLLSCPFSGCNRASVATKPA